MAYTVTTTAQKDIVWDDNPDAQQTSAKIENGVITEFIVLNADLMTVINTTDPAMLAHLQTTIADLLAELTPAP